MKNNIFSQSHLARQVWFQAKRRKIRAKVVWQEHFSPRYFCVVCNGSGIDNDFGHRAKCKHCRGLGFKLVRKLPTTWN